MQDPSSTDSALSPSPRHSVAATFSGTHAKAPEKDRRRGPPASLFLRARHQVAGWGRGEVILAQPEKMAFIVSHGSFDRGTVRIGDRVTDVTLFTPRGRAYEGPATVRRFFTHRGQVAMELEGDHCVDVALAHQASEEGRLRRLFAERASTFGGGHLPSSVHAFVSSLSYDLNAWAELMDTEQAHAKQRPHVDATELDRLIHIASPMLSAHLRQAAKAGQRLLDNATPKDAERAAVYIRSTLAPWMGRSRFVDDPSTPMLPLRSTPSPARPTDAFGAALDRFFTEEPGTMARRQLTALLADRIEAAARASGRPVRILALDSSIAEALALVLARAPHLGPALSITLHASTLDEADVVARALAPVANRARVQLTVRVARRFELESDGLDETDVFDLICAGTFFDVVSDRFAVSTLAAVAPALSAHGSILASTTAHTTPSRFALEIFAGKRQRYRSSEAWTQVGHDVVSQAEVPLTCALEQEPLGIQLLLHLSRREKK